MFEEAKFNYQIFVLHRPYVNRRHQVLLLILTPMELKDLQISAGLYQS